MADGRGRFGILSRPMPPSMPPASSEVETIRQWILAGAPFDTLQPGESWRPWRRPR